MRAGPGTGNLVGIEDTVIVDQNSPGTGPGLGHPRRGVVQDQDLVIDVGGQGQETDTEDLGPRTRKGKSREKRKEKEGRRVYQQ